MTVFELINKLNKFPQDSIVTFLSLKTDGDVEIDDVGQDSIDEPVQLLTNDPRGE